MSVRDELDHRVLRLRGRLRLQNVPRVREAAVKSLLDTGRVLIDLSGLRCAQAPFLAVFPTALGLAGGWPAARLVLFGANAALRSMLASTRVPETVPLAIDRPSARALLERRPPHVRRHHDLPMHNAAPAAARLFVRETCAVWAVPQIVREHAELLSSELVSNAVEHAHSSSRLTITYTDTVLRVSVRDYRPTSIPRPRPIDITAPRGRGLHLVAALAHTWGADQHPDGKTIWANLACRSEQAGVGR
ncbi:MAG: ATP-binding protein [Actinomycetota bacterium]|nr:ATP-binding protein [Actinomycetota bacterium]